MSDSKFVLQLNVFVMLLYGRYLIEVSVGIGKIYNIMCLYFCLLLEKYFIVKEILVMMFIKVVIEEIKGCIFVILCEVVGLW